MELPEECKLYRVSYEGEVEVLATSEQEAEEAAEGLESYDLKDTLSFRAREIKIDTPEKYKLYTNREYKHTLPWLGESVEDMKLGDMYIADIAEIIYNRHLEKKKHEEFLRVQGNLFEGMPEDPTGERK